jgi:RNA polymerase sigma factor (sigma-70 family)
MPVAHPERLLERILSLVPQEARDAELLRRFGQCGDEDALAALIARHGPMVLAVCRRLLRTGGAAEDVAQATFLVLARKAGSVPRPEALAGWLHRTACHLAQKHRRAETRRREREARVSPRISADPVAELADKELREAIDEEIGRMPERFRLPVVLCCLEGRTLEETGKRLDWTPGSVKGRLERGRAELRDRLVRRGFTLSAVCAALDALREGARAGLPAGFGAATLRAAVLFGSGATTGLGNAVASIAEEGVRGATLFTRKVVLSLVLALGVLGGGIAAVAPPSRPVEAKSRADAKPAPAEKPRADRHGDPLPAGAIARLGTVRWRSSEEVEAMAFAPDGKTLAAASWHVIRVFDAKGNLVREIRTDDRECQSLAFSSDGKRLASRSKTNEDEQTAWGRTVRIYDLEGTRKPLSYSEQAIKWAGWSASGEPLAVRQEKDAVVLRDLTSGKERRFEAKDLPAPNSDGLACVYAPTEKVLAFSDSHNAIHIWNVDTRKKLGTLETKGAYAPTLALSPDGRSLAALSANRANEWRTLHLWDVATGKVRHTVTTDQNYNLCMAFAPDGKTPCHRRWERRAILGCVHRTRADPHQEPPHIRRSHRVLARRQDPRHVRLP